MTVEQRYPLPPKTLGVHGKKHWKIGKSLWEAGQLTPNDIPCWLIMCEIADDMEEAKAIIKKEGRYYEMNGAKVKHPANDLLKECKREWFRYSDRFGLMPGARKKANNLPRGSKPVLTRPRG